MTCWGTKIHEQVNTVIECAFLVTMKVMRATSELKDVYTLLGVWDVKRQGPAQSTLER